jgi:ATP-dependent Clp protease ATP-binding subunit ClpC
LGKTPYTDPAQKVLEIARAKAEDNQHGFLGTGVLLVALFLEENGIAESSLVLFGVSVETVEQEVINLTSEQRRRFCAGNVQSRHYLQACEFAEEEARRLRHTAVDTGHLMLGLLRVLGSTAIRALFNVGVDINDLRQQVLHSFGDRPRPQTTS